MSQTESRKRSIEAEAVEEVEAGAGAEAEAEAERAEDTIKGVVAARTDPEAEMNERDEVCRDHEVVVEVKLFATLIVGAATADSKIEV